MTPCQPVQNADRSVPLQRPRWQFLQQCTCSLPTSLPLNSCLSVCVCKLIWQQETLCYNTLGKSCCGHHTPGVVGIAGARVRIPHVCVCYMHFPIKHSLRIARANNICTHSANGKPSTPESSALPLHVRLHWCTSRPLLSPSITS